MLVKKNQKQMIKLNNKSKLRGGMNTFPQLYRTPSVQTEEAKIMAEWKRAPYDSISSLYYNILEQPSHLAKISPYAQSYIYDNFSKENEYVIVKGLTGGNLPLGSYLSEDGKEVTFPDNVPYAIGDAQNLRDYTTLSNGTLTLKQTDSTTMYISQTLRIKAGDAATIFQLQEPLTSITRNKRFLYDLPEATEDEEPTVDHGELKAIEQLEAESANLIVADKQMAQEAVDEAAEFTQLYITRDKHYTDEQHARDVEDLSAALYAFSSEEMGGPWPGFEEHAVDSAWDPAEQAKLFYYKLNYQIKPEVDSQIETLMLDQSLPPEEKQQQQFDIIRDAYAFQMGK